MVSTRIYPHDLADILGVSVEVLARWRQDTYVFSWHYYPALKRRARVAYLDRPKIRWFKHDNGRVYYESKDVELFLGLKDDVKPANDPRIERYREFTSGNSFRFE